MNHIWSFVNGKNALQYKTFGETEMGIELCLHPGEIKPTQSLNTIHLLTGTKGNMCYVGPVGPKYCLRLEDR